MGRRPLKQGEQVSASDYESIAKAVFEAYGTNGIDLRVVGGKLQASLGAPLHPFKVYRTGAASISIVPGFCAAMGSAEHVPEWWDTSAKIDARPAQSKTITEASVVLLHVNYDADEVWQSTEILIEDAAFNYADTYTNGYLLLATIGWASGQISTITQGVTSSLSHSKCNIYHSWQATGQVPATLSGIFTLPAAATDPSGVSAGYIYYNTASGTARLYNGTAWVTL